MSLVTEFVTQVFRERPTLYPQKQISWEDMELIEPIGGEDDKYWMVAGRPDWNVVAQDCQMLELAMKSWGNFSISGYKCWNMDHFPVWQR
jgi:hypothetical protein